jgi:hypothetical protein
MSKNSFGAAPALDQSEPASANLREFSFSDDDFKALAKLAYDHAGISLSEAKRNLVYSRLSRRLRTLQLETFRDYRELVSNDAREIENFINSISTNHTKFFREDHHFDHLRTRVVVPYTQAGSRAGSLRIWSAGTSAVTTGCEALPEAFAVRISAGPNSRPRSDGLIGAASMRTTTSSGPGSATSTGTRESSSWALAVIFERSWRDVRGMEFS